MSKSVLVVHDDHYHPRSVTDPAAEKVFAGADWQVTYTRRVRELIERQGETDLAVLFTPGWPQGEEPLSEAEQLNIAEQVRQGMGMLRVHAGLVLIEPESPFYRELNTGRFVSHPEYQGSVQLPVRYAPLVWPPKPSSPAISPIHRRCCLWVSRASMIFTPIWRLPTCKRKTYLPKR